jgi:hypothetical protein
MKNTPGSREMQRGWSMQELVDLIY